MTCFFDENLPPKLAKALNELEGEHGIKVYHIRDKFLPGTKDIEWIKALSEIDDCFVITKDRKIRQNPHEFLAWKESKLKIVFFQKSWMDQRFWDLSWKFIKRWEEIKKNIKKYDSIHLPIKGEIQIINNLFG